jgi:hypothetical protein
MENLSIIASFDTTPRRLRIDPSWGRSVCTQHKILGSPRLAPRVCTARVSSSNQSAVLSQCTIVMHAADAPRSISTGKLRHLQETTVTKSDENMRQEGRNTKECTYNAVTSCTANMFQEHVGHVYAQRNKCSRRVKQYHAITRKVEALPLLLAKLPRLPWKSNLTPTHAVAATHGSNLINL